MNANVDIDPMQMCRICAVGVDEDTVSHRLIKDNEITELGEKFISCLGIQLMKEGYPERVCDLCQLQLNTFHAFVRKAKNTSTKFENILQQKFKENVESNEIEPDTELDNTATTSKTLRVDDIEFEYGDDDDDDDDDDDEDEDNSNEVEFLIDKRKNRVLSEMDVEYDTSVIEGEVEYTIEYLDPEYENAMIDETIQNDEDEQSDEPEKKGRKQTKPQSKRTYPYKCTKCNKRFVYKEVYEAHIRIHKGLPGFSCPHCPKTFNEKANFDYHMQDHTNYRPAKCHLCEKSFKNKQDLASHIRCHKDIRKYMCDVCGKRFRSQSHMTYHRYAHFEARNFACDQCPQKFKSPHILRTHRNTVHSTVFKYECEQCGRKFKRDHHLVAHRRTHNKSPSSRKPRKKPTEKSTKEETQAYEYVEMIKTEDIELDYGAGFDEEYVTS